MHPPGFLRGVRELTQPIRRAADRRRSGRRLGPHRQDVRLRARRRDARLSLPGQGPDRRLPAAGRDADDRRNLARVPRHVTTNRKPSSTATPTAAIRSAPRSPWPRSTSSRKNRRSTSFRPKIARLGEHLARIAEHPHVGDVRQCGLIAGIELVRDRATKEPYPWAERRGQRVCDHALTEGVWLRPLGNVVVILPPLAISLAELDRICGAVERGIANATDNLV